MWCPRCSLEYQIGIAECGDCGGMLQESSPERHLPTGLLPRHIFGDRVSRSFEYERPAPAMFDAARAAITRLRLRERSADRVKCTIVASNKGWSRFWGYADIAIAIEPKTQSTCVVP
jgi:hypothetical protein